MKDVKTEIIKGLYKYAVREDFGPRVKAYPGTERYGVAFTEVYRGEDYDDPHDMQVDIDLSDFTVHTEIDDEEIAEPEKLAPDVLLEMAREFDWESWFDEGLEMCRQNGVWWH